MAQLPKTYEKFREGFPSLPRRMTRWARRCTSKVPWTSRRASLGLAIGGRQEGAVRSHTRRAVEAGASREEVLHVVALAVTSIGFGPAVAAYDWATEELNGEPNGE